ncbi:MAG: type 4a pilus biogenesis protein PilO [Gammaproteobacteria bacterium]|nr:MAG: type 4a pilus biogenesis protein PilO [Gammaproteobacteria bacterium]
MQVLNQLNQKTFLLMMVGSIFLLVAASSAYGIWPQIKDIKTGLMTRNEMKELVSNKDKLDEQQLKLAQEVKEIKHNLRGDMADLPEKKMEAFIIGELHNISWNHDINLIGVKPVQGNQIQMFQEILFNVQLSGGYFDLYKWLHELRAQLGFIVIKSLELNTINNNDNNSILLMKLTIASYKGL